MAAWRIALYGEKWRSMAYQQHGMAWQRSSGGSGIVAAAWQQHGIISNARISVKHDMLHRKAATLSEIMAWRSSMASCISNGSSALSVAA